MTEEPEPHSPAAESAVQRPPAEPEPEPEEPPRPDPPPVTPPVVASAPTPPVVAPAPNGVRRPERVRRPVAWRSYVGWFAFFWLVTIGCMVWLGKEGLPMGADKEEAVRHAIKAGIGLLVAGLLTFAFPIALLDESSHAERKWWLAWLWPLAMIGMIAVDALAVGVALLPAVKVLQAD